MYEHLREWSELAYIRVGVLSIEVAAESEKHTFANSPPRCQNPGGIVSLPGHFFSCWVT